MEFKKEKVYSAVNADELKPGDKVIVAYDLYFLKRCVKDNSPINTLQIIRGEDSMFRFNVKDDVAAFSLAYLVERKENCTNCVRICSVPKMDKTARCWAYEPKTEQKAEPTYKWVNYRPFKDIDELIKKWWNLNGWSKEEAMYKNKLKMPLLWVRKKLNFSGLKGELITRFEDSYVDVNGRTISLHVLFTEYEFLDGSPCGVEE